MKGIREWRLLLEFAGLLLLFLSIGIDVIQTTTTTRRGVEELQWREFELLIAQTRVQKWIYEVT